MYLQWRIRNCQSGASLATLDSQVDRCKNYNGAMAAYIDVLKDFVLNNFLSIFVPLEIYYS